MKTTTDPTKAVDRIIKHLSTAQKFINGNHVLLIYYIIILIFFLSDILLRHHIKKVTKDKVKIVNKDLLKFFDLYQKHGFIFINIILYCICVWLTIAGEGFDFEYLLTITLSFVIYTVIMKLFLRIFINEKGYKNEFFLRYLHVVCYMILGNFFVFFMPFVKPPNLLMAFFGLIIGLCFCLYLMVRAIFNPEILRRGDNKHFVYSEAYGILKGMFGVLICIIALEYLMVYACYETNHAFYSVSDGRVLTIWDILYYVIISFTTIGYGDIYPVPLDGMFYSEFTAIVIGLTSMFTSGCFISAVISTANNIAERNGPGNDENSET